MLTDSSLVIAGISAAVSSAGYLYESEDSTGLRESCVASFTKFSDAAQPVVLGSLELGDVAKASNRLSLIYSEKDLERVLDGLTSFAETSAAKLGMSITAFRYSIEGWDSPSTVLTWFTASI